MLLKATKRILFSTDNFVFLSFSLSELVDESHTQYNPKSMVKEIMLYSRCVPSNEAGYLKGLHPKELEFQKVPRSW